MDEDLGMDRFGRNVRQDDRQGCSGYIFRDEEGHGERRDCYPDRTERCCGIGQDAGSVSLHGEEDPEETGQKT